MQLRRAELLDLPATLYARSGARTFVAFDEIQDVLRVDGARSLFLPAWTPAS